MAQMTTKYLGGLRTTAQHIKSRKEIMTDAPLDNNGKGGAFSPTDLLCTSLSCCMMTLMGIYAQRENIDISGMQSDITKIMDENPRRVKEVQINFKVDSLKATEIQITKLKRAALTCPVSLSLAESLKQTITFNF
jgi:putative redox protein